MNYDKLQLERAIEKWGNDLQIEMAIEELSELILAIQKLKRMPDSEKRKMGVIEEIADVKIMTEQLSMMFGEIEVQSVIDVKLLRLKVRLDENRFEDKPS